MFCFHTFSQSSSGPPPAKKLSVKDRLGVRPGGGAGNTTSPGEVRRKLPPPPPLKRSSTGSAAESPSPAKMARTSTQSAVSYHRELFGSYLKL